MAWTAPNLWVTGQMVTAALLNTYVRDNLLTLSTHAHGGAVSYTHLTLPTNREV